MGIYLLCSVHHLMYNAMLFHLRFFAFYAHVLSVAQCICFSSYFCILHSSHDCITIHWFAFRSCWWPEKLTQLKLSWPLIFFFFNSGHVQYMHFQAPIFHHVCFCSRSVISFHFSVGIPWKTQSTEAARISPGKGLPSTWLCPVSSGDQPEKNVLLKKKIVFHPKNRCLST